MKWILLSIVVTATALSDLLQSHEMKRAGEQSVGARGLARLLQTIAKRRYLILSIVCLAISFFAFMALVQRARLHIPVDLAAHEEGHDNAENERERRRTLYAPYYPTGRRMALASSD